MLRARKGWKPFPPGTEYPGWCLVPVVSLMLWASLPHVVTLASIDLQRYNIYNAIYRNVVYVVIHILIDVHVPLSLQIAL